MTTATIEGVRTLSYIPTRGKRFLSVNLALVGLAEIGDLARELGFKLELVQIPCKTGTQIHALLWEGEIADTPPDLDERVDALADRINTDAIRHTWNQGRSMVA